MTLREKLLQVPGVGPRKVDAILEVVASEPSEDKPGDALLSAVRSAKTGANHPNGCPFCGIDGCHEKCPAWTA